MRPTAGGRIKGVKDRSRVDLSCFDFVAPGRGRSQGLLLSFARLKPRTYQLTWFVLTDLCKIPLTMSIENLFPPVPVTAAPVPDESDHVLAFGCVDLGYAYVRDTKENVRRRSSRRSSVDVEAPSGAAAEGVV